MTRKLVVEIVGDASSLNAAFGKAAASANTFGGRMQAAGEKIAGVGKHLAIMGAAVTGVSGVVGKQLVDAAMQAQEQTGKLDVALRNAGMSANKLRPQIDALEQSNRRLGFTNADTRDSLTRLVQSGDKMTAATKDMALAQDLARVKSISLGDATSMLVKVHQGLLRPLKELGISLPSATDHMDALKKAAKAAGEQVTAHAKALAFQQDKLETGREAVALMTQKLHGQADEYSKTAAGGMASFTAQIGNIKERMGSSLLPLVVKLTDFLSKLADKFSSLSPHMQKMIALGVAAAFGLGAAVTVIGSLVTAVGGLTTALAFLAANPIVLAIAGVAALAAAVAAAVLFPDKLRGALEHMGLSANAAGKVVSGLQDVFAAVKAAGEFLVTAVKAHWTEISAVITGAINIVRTVIHDAIVIVTALWNTFGSTLVAQAKVEWNYIKDTIKNALEIIHGIIDVITGLIHGDWAKVWKGIQEIVSGTIGQLMNELRTAVSTLGNEAKLIGEALWKGIVQPLLKLGAELLRDIKQAIITVVNDVVGWVGDIAAKIGQAIKDGIIHGAEGLAKGLGDKLKSGVSGAKDAVTGFLHINSPSLLFSEGVGKPIAEGIEHGYLIGSASLPSKISASVRQALEAAKRAIDSYRAQIATAWSQLTQDADTAFDALAAKMKTKSEKILANIISAQDAADFKKNLGAAVVAVSDAQNAMNDYLGSLGATPEQLAAVQAALAQVTSAQNALNDAVVKFGPNSAQAQAALQGLRDAQGGLSTSENAAGVDPAKFDQLNQQLVQSQAQVDDLMSQKHQAALQKRAAQERVNLDAQEALKKRHMDEALAGLEAHLEKTGATYAQAQTAILKLLGKYGVNFKAAGLALGTAFAKGLGESTGAATKAVEALAAEIAKYLPHSPADKGPLSQPIGWHSYLTGGLAGSALAASAALAAGLTVPAVASAHTSALTAGRATSSSLAGARVAAGTARSLELHVHVHADTVIGGDMRKVAQDLSSPLRDELVRIARAEPNIFGGRA